MSFTAQELAKTANELRGEINRFLSQPTNPDVLLGNHPAVALASQKQSIAIWHGQRIEDHLADWINRVPGWIARARERISIASSIHEIDNLAWNPQIGVVLAVEAKRVWANQDGSSKADVRRKNKLYMDPANTPTITSHVGLSGASFRHFVFDVYGRTKTGSRGLPVIAGDKISHVFDHTLATYVEWERQVMANAIFEKIDPNSHHLKREHSLADESLGTRADVYPSREGVLDYIDKHAN
ncbi:hypothetical protein GA0061098_102112 [Bradyrhizobium shewense]|uniref:Uncharacterized protein n=1 Tax=Bradyrhizobium shewense TaxID=1761772 RepID=A0A1C3XNS6_9BRAD|nr:hypothetical protein [Bradyrhizobium shewense]SCB53805.1 hypothetical protein GA0061098_102112 [Bradyrhizobium shewense]